MNEIELQKEIDHITRQIVEKYKPEKIILFGSAAWGNMTPDSDLDFLVVKKDVPYYGADRMRELSKLIKRNMAVDMLVYKPEEINKELDLGDPFIKLVLSKGKVLYG